MLRKVLVVVAAVFVSTAVLHAQTIINGAGSTFIYPMFTKWSDTYHKMHPNVELNYQSIGSGGGINQLTSGTVEIGASDAPLNDEQIAACEKAHGAVVHLPEAMGAVAVSYDIPGVKATLKFTGEALANIFLGNIAKWNDPVLKKLNPGVNLPDHEIIVVHRADGSGDTYIFVDYLCKVSKEWNDKVGKGTSVNWPVGLGAKGNEGVSGQLEQTPYSIGYITLIYALQNHIAYGSMKNADGEFIHPTIKSVSDAAANAAKIVPADLGSPSRMLPESLPTQFPARHGLSCMSTRPTTTSPRRQFSFFTGYLQKAKIWNLPWTMPRYPSQFRRWS